METPVFFDKMPADFDSALILQFVGKNELVFVRNSKRKWELTGGKREPGETLTQNVVRESFEESGAIVDEESIQPLGYYQLPSGHITVIVTTQVKEFKEIPPETEIVERQISAVPLAPELLSFHDNVYQDIFQHLGWGGY